MSTRRRKVSDDEVFAAAQRAMTRRGPLELTLADIAAEAGASLVGSSSLKAALDLDWDDPTAREQALVLVLGALEAVERWLETTPVGSDAPGIRESLMVAQQV